MILLYKFNNNRFLYTTIGGALLVIGVLFLYLHTTTTPKKTIISSGFTDGILKSTTTSIAISIADTEDERSLGLSGTQSLPENAGKFFVFPQPGVYGFWMKDMNYGIDIIWLDSTLSIVGIESEVLPESYPNVVYPPSDILYVLEVPARFSTTHGLLVGQSFTLQK